VGKKYATRGTSIQHNRIQYNIKLGYKMEKRRRKHYNIELEHNRRKKTIQNRIK